MFQSQNTDYSPMLRDKHGSLGQNSFVRNPAKNLVPSDSMEDMRGYSLTMAMRVWQQNSGNSQQMMADFALYEAYAQGMQPMQHYRNFKEWASDNIVGRSQAAKSISEAQARSIGLGNGQDGDLLRFKQLSSMLEAAQGKIVPLKRDISVTATGAKAKEMKAAQINQIKASNYIKQNLPPETLQYSDPSGVQPVEEKPLPIEDVLSRGVNDVLNLTAGKWREIEQYLAHCGMVQGLAGVKVEVTPTYSIAYRIVDVTRLVIPIPTQRDCSDLKVIGERIVLPVADLMALDPDKYYTTDDWASCPPYYETGVYTPDNVSYSKRVEVLDFEWTDVKKNAGRDVLCVYRAKWVIGTSIIVDYGMREFQVRGNKAAGQFNDVSEFSFILYSPYAEAKTLKINSLVARAISDIKAYEVCRINFFLEIINAIPTTYVLTEGTLQMIDEMFSGLSDQTNQENKQLNDPYLAFEMLRTGRMIMPDPKESPVGIIKADPPFRIEGGIPKAALDYAQQGEFFVQKIKENLGIPSGMDASLAAPEQSVRSQLEAMQASQSVLSKIADGNENIFIRVCRQIAMILPQIAWDMKEGVIEYSDIMLMFTPQEQEVLSNIHEIQNYNLDFNITSAPTGVQMTQYEQALDIAVQQGVITGAQRIRFSDMARNSFQTALAQLEKAEDENKKLQHEQQMAIQQANAQGNLAAAQEANKGAMEKSQMEGQNEVSKVDAQTQGELIKMQEEFRLKMLEMERKYQLEKELAIIINQTKPQKPNE